MSENRIVVYQQDGVTKSGPVHTGKHYIQETRACVLASDGVAYRREWSGKWAELKKSDKYSYGYVREPDVTPPDWVLMYLLLTE